MPIVDKARRVSRFLFSLPATIYFNFRNFPFKQAVKLPVWLCMPKIIGKGSYSIEGKVRSGMIRLGFPIISVFKEKGIVLENRGKVIFKGDATIGGGGALSVGETGCLTLGHRFCNLYGAKIICYHQVTFEKVVRLGWSTVVMDTDFHTLKTPDGSNRTKGFGPIHIGEEVWVGSYCKIYKNAVIPSRCTVASSTVINKPIECEPCSLIYPGYGIKVKHTGCYRDVDDDQVRYEIGE